MNICNEHVKDKSAYCTPQYIKEVKDRLILLPKLKMNIADVRRELLNKRARLKNTQNNLANG